MRAAIYSRYSTDQQSAASVEDQIRGAMRVAAAEELDVVSRFDDRGISAGTHQRPGYQSMLIAARAHEFDVIIAEDISRLWRNRAEWGVRSAELEDLGINLVTCVGDDTRRDGWGLVLGIKQALAEQQRREISYRTRRGMEGLALAGKSTGGRCYGYRGTELEPLEALRVEMIFEMAARGMSQQAIADELNSTAVPGPRGGVWGRTTLAAILRNARYTGRTSWGKVERRPMAADSARKTTVVRPSPLVERPDESQRIVSEDLWARARRGMRRRNTKKASK